MFDTVAPVGVLDFAEYKNAYQRVLIDLSNPIPEEKTFVEVFEQYDADQDGSLNEEEFFKLADDASGEGSVRASQEEKAAKSTERAPSSLKTSIYVTSIVFIAIFVWSGNSKEMWYIVTWVCTFFILLTFIYDYLTLTTYFLYVLFAVFIVMMLEHHDYLFHGKGAPSMNILIFTNLCFHIPFDFADMYVLIQDFNDALEHGVGGIILTDRQKELMVPLRLATMVCSLLGVFFHQQSYPSSSTLRLSRFPDDDKVAGGESDGDSTWSPPATMPRKSLVLHERPHASFHNTRFFKERKRVSNLPYSVRRFWFVAKQFLVRIIFGPMKKLTMADYESVSFARKRAAVVSILFIDVPFLFIRISAMKILDATMFHYSFLFSLWPKNLFCIVVQSMWLRNCQKLNVCKLSTDRENEEAFNSIVFTRIKGTQRFQCEDSDYQLSDDAREKFVTSHEAKFKDVLQWSGTTESASTIGPRSSLRSNSDAIAAEPWMLGAVHDISSLRIREGESDVEFRNNFLRRRGIRPYDRAIEGTPNPGLEDWYEDTLLLQPLGIYKRCEVNTAMLTRSKRRSSRLLSMIQIIDKDEGDNKRTQMSKHFFRILSLMSFCLKIIQFISSKYSTVIKVRPNRRFRRFLWRINGFLVGVLFGGFIAHVNFFTLIPPVGEYTEMHIHVSLGTINPQEASASRA